ncbi:hypothetical protein ACIPY6_34615 [Streptomyces sp. NPDC090054]|uniref:hypothetical protein n=1 Tax=Streptomyces sp. NPDC090054 TaxID=3365933 RepID=UPI00382E5778
MTSDLAGAPMKHYEEIFAAGLATVRRHLAGLREETGGVESRVEALDQKIDRSHDQIIGLLTQLVERRPAAC